MPGADQSKRTRWRLAISAGLIGGALCFLGVYYVASRRAADPLTRGVAAYDAGHWDAAAGLARDALKLRPDDVLALRLLARSSTRLGRDEAARAIYSRRPVQLAIEAEDYIVMGLSLERRGQAEAAARAWEKAVESDEVSPRALDEVARLYLRGRRYEEAARLAERLCAQKGWEAPGLLMLGSIRATLNDPAAAALSFRRALDLDAAAVDRSGDPAKLRTLIGRTFLRMGRPVEARAALEPIQAAGGDSAVPWLLSRAFLQEGEISRAEEAMAQARTYRSLAPLESEPGPYVGEAACEQCHRDVFRDSLGSRHTRSYYRGAELKELPRPAGPLADPDDPKVAHAFTIRDGALWEETRVGEEVLSAVIDYAFGTSDRYLTMVSRDGRGEHHIARLSYYNTPEGRGWDRSSLDKIHPSTGRSEQFQGGPISSRAGVAKCLYCHTTNTRTGQERTGPESADHAIGCERCHGPGGHHVAAVNAGFSDPAIVNPAHASPQAVTSKLCNDCHILGPNVPDRDQYGPEWVRSQGVGWTLSRCNIASDGAFGCVSCHDPHKGARAITTAQYEAKCLNCHSATPRAAKNQKSNQAPRAGGGRMSPACPVDPAKGCVSCHMPRVRINALHLKLTDHFIRIPKTGRSAAH
jgi:predicted CXXCH cytochrome family protein